MYRIILFLALFGCTKQQGFRRTRYGDEGYGGLNLLTSSNNAGSSNFANSNNYGSSGFGNSNNPGISIYGNSRNCRNKPGYPFPRFGGPNFRSSIETTACDIAKGLVDVDRLIQGYCQAHAEHYMRESYGVEYYKLILAVDDFDEDTISVKVLHKMIIVSAENCDSTFADIRILPDVINLNSGKWRYEQGELTIYFRYIMRALEVLKYCGPNINTNVRVVPRASQIDIMEQDFAVQFGDDSFRDSVKTFYSQKQNNNYVVNVKF